MMGRGKGVAYDMENCQGKFPSGAVVILALCTTLQCYTLVSLFPYVGLMVEQLLRLETTNEAGEIRQMQQQHQQQHVRKVTES